MAPVSDKQLSIKLASFFLRFVGFWPSNNHRERWILNCALTYSFIAVIFGSCVLVIDLYHSLGDFYKLAYALTNIVTDLMVVFKLVIFTMKRDEVIQLIRHSKENFWDIEYDYVEKKVLDNCEKQCMLFVSAFTLFAQGTVCSYTITPIIDNIGKNETDRSLPFTIWLDLPITTTPYFEMLFFIETLSLYHIGVLYFCFDNLLCILNVHVNGQFQILRYRLETTCNGTKEDGTCKITTRRVNNDGYIGDSDRWFKKLKICIRQHQSLIEFVEKIESAYSLVILGQVLVFSGLICLVAYQAFLESSDLIFKVGGPFLRRVIFLAHSAGTFVQLFMFTLTCHNLWEGSLGVSNGAYHSDWYLPENNSAANALKKDLILIMMRAQRPCCLTAFGFFPITLETFMSINSTAVSYLTLLRQSAE